MSLRNNILCLCLMAAGASFADWRPVILSHGVPAVQMREGIVTGTNESLTNALQQRLMPWQYPQLVDGSYYLRITTGDSSYGQTFLWEPTFVPTGPVDYSSWSLFYDYGWEIDPFTAGVFDLWYTANPVNFAAAVLCFGFGGFTVGVFVSMVLSWLLDIRKLFA